jgi:glycosyltransferase involved in cell wall biosynthesis
MRIAVVATEIKVPDQHGGSTHVSELVRGFRKHGETLLLARRGSHGPGIAPIGMPLRRGNQWLRHVDAAFMFPDAFRELSAFKPDAIYERCTSYGLGAMLSLATGAPLITMVLDQRFSWLSMWRANALISTRLDLLPEAVRSKGVKVHWGANTELFTPGIDPAPLRAELGIPNGATVVGYSGSFKSWHGLELMVEVAARIRRDDLYFLLVGDGPLREDITARVRGAGLEKQFLFTGSVDYEQVPASLAPADLCIAPFNPDKHKPSLERGSFVLDPLKVFEYLALGKPTLTIDSENISSIFADGDSILLYEPNSADALESRLRWALDHPRELAQTAIQGRQIVLDGYTWQAHSDHLVRLFAQMGAPA